MTNGLQVYIVSGVALLLISKPLPKPYFLVEVLPRDFPLGHGK